jgi:hypothetical protein
VRTDVCRYRLVDGPVAWRAATNWAVVLSSCLMRTEPLAIQGLAGPVVLTSGFLSNKYSVTVGGLPATHIGRGRYSLPAAGGGTVEATVRSGFADPYPTLEINGVKHRSGPPVPLALRVLALVPIALIGFGGLLGGLIGGLGVMANLAVASQPRSAVVKALLMLGVLVVAVVVWIVVAAAIGLAVR